MQTAFTKVFHRSRSGVFPKLVSFFSQCISLSNSGGGKKIRWGANFHMDRSLKLQGDKHLLNKNFQIFQKWHSALWWHQVSWIHTKFEVDEIKNGLSTAPCRNPAKSAFPRGKTLPSNKTTKEAPQKWDLWLFGHS